MLTQQVATIERAWPVLSPVITVTHTEADYDKLISLFDALIDLIGGDEEQLLASLMELIGVLIEPTKMSMCQN